jgi:hypothetical protein
MKKTLLWIAVVLIFLTGSIALANYRVVDVYVCHESVTLAELQAKVSVSRSKLAVVSGCRCEGVNRSFKSEVDQEPMEIQGIQVKQTDCDDEGALVYSCICYGRDTY